MKQMNIDFEIAIIMRGNDALHSSKNAMGIALKNFDCDLTYYHLPYLGKSLFRVLHLLRFC